MTVMNPQRYIAIETAIGIVINAVISIAFAWLVFGLAARVPTAALICDAVPQSFMIALMSGIVPTVLTHRRRRKGLLAAVRTDIPSVLRKIPVRILLTSVFVAATGVALHAAILPNVAPDGLSLGGMFVFKTLYGATLAAIVTPLMVRLALADPIA